MSQNNSEFCILLVEAVEKRKFLYDSNDTDYSRREKIERAWTEISNEIKQQESVCKSKRNNIRTGFYRSLRNYTPSGSATTSNKKKYYLHDELQFLIPHLHRKKQYGNLSELHSPEATVCSFGSERSDGLANGKDSNAQAMETTHTGDDSNSIDFNTSKKRNTRIKQNECDKAIVEYLQEKRVAKSDPAEEAMLSFFKSLLPDVLKLTSKRQRMVKSGILQLVDNLANEQEEEITGASTPIYFSVSQNFEDVS